ncbi:hypothetical protein ACSNOH_08580 [Streptomyces sp. URMC 127]|uniref:hypothetical protein n=1 Tax=Streptomyces sp. URMC 127 TaxID=3423402 RepID=UPI003F1A8482
MKGALHPPWRRRPAPGPARPPQGRRFGGALLNEAFDDDEPEVVVNNYYED